MVSWYYVKGSERVGPVSEEELKDLFISQELDEESFVWTKGFDNWKKLETVGQLAYFLELDEAEPEEEGPVHFEANDKFVNFESMDEYERCIHVKIGIDRGCEEAEYGPYNLHELKKAFKENRINERTLIFVPGMDQWEFLGDLSIYKSLSPLPPQIKDEDRRRNIRRPFVARMLFHDNEQLFEGICRDVSIGGAQVLVSNYPGQIGDEVTMNVHPENSQYGFVAKGKIVRILDGDQGFSLRFSEMDDEAKQAIEEYVSGN